MSRQTPFVGLVLTAVMVALTGCGPQQPFYFHRVDGDLAHYKGVATEIEYPDVEADRLADVAEAQRPFSLVNKDPKNFWELSLEEAMQIALSNNRVMRNIGGQVQGMPDFLLRNPELAPTIYGPALAEANPRTGAEAALSAFDTQLSSSVTWGMTDAPQNISGDPNLTILFPRVSEHDQGSFQAKLSKVTATGGQFSLTHNVIYDLDRFSYPPPPATQRLAWPSDWNVNLEARWQQPLLQGAGVQFNRIAGPGAQPGVYNGVVLARINTDIALADFEASVRNLISDVENTYWELYFAYRSLDAVKAGYESALVTWRKVQTLQLTSSKGGEADKEAQARQQVYLFRSTAERSLSSLYAAESRLRYMLGLAATDGRLIRPKDELTTAKVTFDWCEVLNEGLARSVELREQKWIVKRRELELIAAKNFLLPKVDFVALYRWLGLGNRLDGTDSLDWDQNIVPAPDANAYRTMTDGQYQEWQLGVQATIPLGFRRELAGVRHAQLSVAQEQAKLQEGELELSHQLAFAIRELEANHVLSETNFNRRVAAQREVEAVTTAYETGTITIDRVLDAQQKLAQAESDYYRSLVDYVKSIAQVHFRKGSLLEYNGVYLTEGPWPGKAYFDARRRARAREASIYLDYGFTQPRVVSRGPIEQQAGGGAVFEGDQPEAAPVPSPTPASSQPELVPTPEPEPLQTGAVPAEPPVAPQPAGEPQASVSGSGGKQRGWTAVMRMPSAPARRTADRQVDVGVAVALPPQEREYNSRPNSGRPNKTASGWTAVEKAGYDEPSANPATAPVDRPASGWKGVQR